MSSFVPTVAVSADEIILLHDGISNIISALDALGNGEGEPTQVITDAIADLSVMLEGNMFMEAGELLDPSNGWDDDEGVTDIDGVTHV